ncbi:hypothetical protein M2437_004659 [Methylorubrum pseudosasae]|nr:hypothetical protein [Methylorubrum pseudosasae]
MSAVKAAAPTRRVKTPGQRHRCDRKGDANADRNDGIGNEVRGKHAHERGDGVAADDRPGLGERTGGHGEDQHRRRPHRRDDQRDVGAFSEEPAADQAGERDARKSTQARDQALTQGRAGQNRPEQAESVRSFSALFRATGVGHPRAFLVSRPVSALPVPQAGAPPVSSRIWYTTYKLTDRYRICNMHRHVALRQGRSG